MITTYLINLVMIGGVDIINKLEIKTK